MAKTDTANPRISKNQTKPCQQRGVLEQFYASLKRIDGDAGRQLQGRHSPQTEEWPQERIPNHFVFAANGHFPRPQQKQYGGAYFQYRLRPGLNCAMCENGKSDQRTETDAYGPHRRAPAGRRATSSTHTVPLILLSKRTLGTRRRRISIRCVCGPVVKSAS